VDGVVIVTSCNNNFGGLEPKDSAYEKAAAVILPVPYEGTVSYKGGTARGPAAIIEASMNMELYDEELDQETYKIGIHTLPPVEAVNVPSKMTETVCKSVLGPLRDGKFLVTVGGEHSVTNGIVDAFVETRGHDFGVLLDAHGDLRDSYQGTPFSHASIMRRINDKGLAYSQVGIRSLSREEADFISREERSIYFAHEILTDDTWMKKVIDELPHDVYITIDLDCLDPSIMPSTGTPEPGGLSWQMTTAFLRDVSRKKTVIGFDVVELSPIEGFHAPDFLAAKLVYRTLGYIFKKHFSVSEPMTDYEQ
jgi:agmatinase